MTNIWNPWHGCRKYSEGCAHCYVYRRDASVGRDASAVTRTRDFNLPVRRGRDRAYVMPSGSVFACMTSDFFLEEADVWRAEAWEMIRNRPDVHFTIITKRIVRFDALLPSDWLDGYDNVTIGCTVENQKQADIRLPVFLEMPIRHRFVICEPLLGEIDLEKYLSNAISRLVAGGESGDDARVCDFDWVRSLRAQCDRKNVPFTFKQTGAFFRKDGRLYGVPRALQLSQARKAGLDT